MGQILSSLTDNQSALLGCATALIGAYLVLALSYYRGKRVGDSGDRGAHLQVMELPAARNRRRAA